MIRPVAIYLTLRLRDGMGEIVTFHLTSGSIYSRCTARSLLQTWQSVSSKHSRWNAHSHALVNRTNRAYHIYRWRVAHTLDNHDANQLGVHHTFRRATCEIHTHARTIQQTLVDEISVRAWLYVHHRVWVYQSLSAHTWLLISPVSPAMIRTADALAKICSWVKHVRVTQDSSNLMD